MCYINKLALPSLWSTGSQTVVHKEKEKNKPENNQTEKESPRCWLLAADPPQDMILELSINSKRKNLFSEANLVTATQIWFTIVIFSETWESSNKDMLSLYVSSCKWTISELILLTYPLYPLQNYRHLLVCPNLLPVVIYNIWGPVLMLNFYNQPCLGKIVVTLGIINNHNAS